MLLVFSKRGPLIEKGSQMLKQNFWKFFGKIGYLSLNEIIMGQRIKITEEQKEHLLGMYGLNEQPTSSIERSIDNNIRRRAEKDNHGGEPIGVLSDGDFKDLIEKLSKCVDEDGLNKMKRLNPEQKKEFVERMEIALGIYKN